MAGNGQALPKAVHSTAGGNAVLGGVVLSGSSKVTRLKTHKMAKKIEGIAMLDGSDGRIDGFLVGTEKPEVDSRWSFPAATLVVYDGAHERVFTESEVRAMVTRSYDMGFKCAVGYNDNYVHFQGEQRLRVMGKDFQREGFPFDPA